MEWLEHLIQDRLNSRRWVRVRLGPSFPAVSHLFYVAQSRIISITLDRFCEESRLKVNVSKSKIFDSPKYLGVLLVHGRTVNDTFQDVIKRVRDKLSSWKASCLSLAGFATLVRTVTSSIPVYTMESAHLPASICVDLAKRNQSFLWPSGVLLMALGGWIPLDGSWLLTIARRFARDQSHDASCPRCSCDI